MRPKRDGPWRESMLYRSIRPLCGPALLGSLLALGLVSASSPPLLAQYHTTETTPIPGAPQGAPPGSGGAPVPSPGSATGPVRLARFAYVHGSVSWRPDSSEQWAQAVDNLPIREGS